MSRIFFSFRCFSVQLYITSSKENAGSVLRSSLGLALAILLLTATGLQAQTSVGTANLGATVLKSQVPVTAQNAGTVATVKVLTQGASGLEFAVPPSPGFTCQGSVLAVGGICQQSVTLTPAYPGLRIGAVVLLDASNNLIGETLISGTGTGGLGVLVPGNLIPVAGDGSYLDTVVDHIPALATELNEPTCVVLDGAGNLYIADRYHNRIRMVSASTSLITTISGDGGPGYTGDHGLATLATLNAPAGLAIDGVGNLYIADSGNNVVRRIDAVSGIITTVAGDGTKGTAANVGDGGLATAANLNLPQGVSLDLNGNLFIADTENHRIRKVSAVNGMITAASTIATVAGNGFQDSSGAGTYLTDGVLATSTPLNEPYAVVFDAAGNMYFPDSANNRIRVVNAVTQIITTVAGSGMAGYSGDEGLATAAELDAPLSVAMDAAGNLYIADTQNNAIRKVNAGTGIIATLVVNTVGEYLLNGTLSAISVNGPMGMALDGSGDIYYADHLNMRIREVQSNLAALDYTRTVIRQGSQSVTQDQTVENDGNAPLDLTALTVQTESALDATATTCSVNIPLGTAADCTMGVIFAPAPSPALLVNTTETSDVLVPFATTQDFVGQSSPLTIEVVGLASPVDSTTVVLSSTPDPSTFGQAVTLSATVSTGTGTLIGTVSLFDTFGGSTTMLNGGLSLSATNVATYTTSILGVGLHKLKACYVPGVGDTHFASCSTDNGVAAVVQEVDESTATSLATSGSPSTIGATVDFTATVTVNDGGGVTPDGTVTFTDGGTTLGSVAINSSGIAVYPAVGLTGGNHTITAIYNGDNTIQVLGSTSASLVQDVQGAATVALTSNLNPSNYGSAVVFTVTVTPGQAQATTGTVNILDGAVKIGTVTLAGTPAGGTFSTSTLSVGSHTITAVYTGNSFYGSSTSPAVLQVVSQTQTSTTLAVSANPGIAGVSETLTATVLVTAGAGTPTGTVTFTDGAITLGSTALGASGTASISVLLAAGSHSIVASYSGDTDDAASASGALSLPVNLATTTTTLGVSSNPALMGMKISFTAKVTGNGAIPTGTVTFTDGGVALGTGTLDATGTATFSTTTLSQGTHVILATYGGDTNDGGSVSSPLSLIVNLATTTTTLSVSSNPALMGLKVTFTAKVAGNGGIPTGTVTFTDGGTTLGTGTLDATGTATFSTTALSQGVHTILATYGGDTDDGGSVSSPLSLTVNLATTATALSSSATTANVDTPVLFTAKVTGNGGIPTGTVTFTADGVTIGTGTLDATGTATLSYSALNTSTPHTILAIYGGDTDDTGSTSNAVTETITLISTITSLGSSTTQGANPETILVATVSGASGPSPTGTVNFTVNGVSIGAATLDGNGVATLIPNLASGTYSVVANYLGDPIHFTSSSAVVTISNIEAGFSMSVTPTAVTIKTTQNSTVMVTLTSNNGYIDNIGLGCASLPALVTCHFASVTTGLAANASATVQLTIDTNDPLSGGTVGMNSEKRSMELAGLLFPCALLFGGIFWRWRRRNAWILSTVLVLLGSGALLLVSGCSGITQKSAAPGTYVIQVIGVGESSDISHYQNVTLNITQ